MVPTAKECKKEMATLNLRNVKPKTTKIQPAKKLLMKI